MALRDIVVENYRWKLTALLLAMLVWFVIKFAIYKGITGGRNQELPHQPVMVLKASDDTRTFRIDPSHVNVVLKATRELSSDDVKVFLDLTTMPDVDSALKQVLVRAADATKVVRTEPAFILVERVGSPADTSLTNSFRR